MSSLVQASIPQIVKRIINAPNLREEIVKLSKILDQMSFIQVINGVYPDITALNAPLTTYTPTVINIPNPDAIIRVYPSPNGKYLALITGNMNEGDSDEDAENVILHIIDLDIYFTSNLTGNYDYNVWYDEDAENITPFIFTPDERAVMYRDDKQNWHLLTFHNSNNIIIPWIQTTIIPPVRRRDLPTEANPYFFNNLLVFMGNNPGVAEWKDDQLIRIGDLNAQVSQFILNRVRWRLMGNECSSIIRWLLKPEFSDGFSKITNIIDKPTNLIFSPNCKYILVIPEDEQLNKVSIIKIGSDQFQIIELILPTGLYNNYRWTDEDQLLIWDKEVYISNLPNTGWKSIIIPAQIGLDKIFSVYPYIKGLLIEGVVNEHQTLVNFNTKTNHILFRLMVPLNILLIDRGTAYFTWIQRRKPPDVFDAKGQPIPVHFDIAPEKAETLAVDLINQQFKLYPVKFLYGYYVPNKNINNKSGIYNHDYRHIYFLDRRLSFLKQMINLEVLFDQAKIPFPAGILNTGNLEQILELYHQRPNEELIQSGLRPYQTMVPQQQFEQIMLKLFYSS